MLFVHDHQAEILEGHFFGKQGVGAEEQVDLAPPERPQEEAPWLAGD